MNNPHYPLGPLLVDVASTTLQREDHEILCHPLVGAVILFARNFKDRTQVTELVRQIKSLRTPELLVCVDQEGGRVQRFKNDFTELPPLHSLGDLYSDDPDAGLQATSMMARLMASEVRNTGVDFSFAPVVDLFNPDSRIIANRAFDSEPEVIAQLATAYMNGLHEVGMIAVAKHFPGHGGVLEDSHLCLPVDSRCYGEIRDHDLVPYQELIANGLDALLTAHVRFTRIDEMPSGFSPFWIQTILRRQMRFKGLVFTDDLSMQGAVEFGSILDRTRLALEAGCDMALICNDRPAVERVLDDADLLAFIKPHANLETRVRRLPDPTCPPTENNRIAATLERLAGYA